MTEVATDASASNQVSGENSQTDITGKRVFVPEKKTTPNPYKKVTEDKTSTGQPAINFKGTKHKVKLDGQELDVDYDELITSYQKRQVSDKRFQEAQALAKQAQQIQQAVQSGDMNALVNMIGPDKAREMFEDYLIQQMEWDNLPAEQKRLYQLEHENKMLMSEKERAKQEHEERQKQEESLKAQQQIDQEVSEALQAMGRKPTPRLVIRIVDEMLARMGRQEGFSAKKAAELAMKGIQFDVAEYLPQLNDDELFKVIPKEILERIRKRELNQALDERGSRRVKAPNQDLRKPKKTFNIEEKFKEIEKKFMR